MLYKLCFNAELEESPEDTVKPEKFRWDTIVLNILEKAPDNEMALKKLKKKVNITGSRK
jgi:hypothetical protein